MSDETIGVEDFREKARAWLAANMEKRTGGEQRRTRGTSHYTKESVAPQRVLQKKVYEAGFAGITWPAEYGGQGLTSAHERAFQAEAAGYVMPDLGVSGGTTVGVCGPTMLQFATPEFLKRHIPRMLAGDEIVCQFFSEPGAGSDLAGVQTRATQDGDRWILNGSKVWSSGAAYATHGMCLARTDWDAPKHQGLTWFLVPCDAKGVEVVPIKEINGDAEFCQEYFDDVDIPDSERIGEVNRGWTVAQAMLVFERGAGRTDSPAPLAGPGPLSPDLVALAKRVGREKDPAARQLLAKAHTASYVQAQLGRRIVGLLRGAGGNAAGVASYGKLSMANTGNLQSRIAMDIAGGAALTWEDGDLQGMSTALNYLNGRLGGIAGGTNEMQRNGIGERVLGLPREPSFDSVKPFSEVIRNAGNFERKF